MHCCYSAEVTLLQLTLLHLLSSVRTALSQDQNCTEENPYNSCCNGCGYTFDSTETLKKVIKDYFNATTGKNKYGEMNCWDVSKIEDMREVFRDYTYNEPIECWDIGNVTNMHAMFSGATSFNQPLNSWDVSSVMDMGYMFYGAESFNQPLSSWNVSKVFSMDSTFAHTEVFNQPLNSWDVIRVTSMKNMFNGARKFDQNLCAWYIKSCQNKTDFSNMFYLTLCTFTSDPACDSKSSFCDTCPKVENLSEYNPKKGDPVPPKNLGLILGLSLVILVAVAAAILFLSCCRKKDSENPKDNFVIDQIHTEAFETQEKNQKALQDVKNEKKSKLYGPAPFIEVDDLADNVSTLQDIELPSEEMFDDRTAGFSTIEFCTMYENYLHGSDMNNIFKSSSTTKQKSEQRDFESACIPEPTVEMETSFEAESLLNVSAAVDVQIDRRKGADEIDILNEGVESSPPQLSDFTRKSHERRISYSLPVENSNSQSDKTHVIVYAPPGELGLTIIGDSKSGQVQVHRIKLISPLRSFIQEGDVLKSVDGESTAGLTTSQASSRISSRVNNSSRALVFTRNVDGSSNPLVEQFFEGDKVIVYAPPGELGLTIDGDTKNGQLIVHSVKSFSPLYSKIQEGDILKYVDGESTAELTATEVLSLISNRASNPVRFLAFDRRSAESEG